ncbi:MAG: hypothetical protein AAF612_00200 [Planctomycetota bacterium]
MDPHAPPPPSASAPAGLGDERLDFDLPCRRCGFNLRGLLVSQACPECSLPIEQSLPTERLADADPEWLATLRSGVNLLLVGVGLIFAIAIVGGVVGMYLGAANPNQPPNLQSVAAIGVFVAMIHLLGVWRVTTPEPGVEVDTPQTTRARATARYAALAAALAGLVAGVLSMASTLPPAAAALSAVSTLCSAAATFALLWIGRSLVRRLPDAPLEKSTTQVMWGLTAVTVLSGLTELAAPATGPGNPNNAPAFSGWLVGGCALGLAALYFGIYAIVLLFKYRNRMTAVLAEASSPMGGSPLAPPGNDTPWAQ